MQGLNQNNKDKKQIKFFYFQNKFLVVIKIPQQQINKERKIKKLKSIKLKRKRVNRFLLFFEMAGNETTPVTSNDIESAILSHTLSFLAVSTSLLSSKWCN